MVTVPTGSANEPASLPSARRAVSTTPLVAAAGAAGAGEPAALGAPIAPGALDGLGGGAIDGALPSLNPHDAQNLLLDGFGCSHWGQMTGGPPVGAASARAPGGAEGERAALGGAAAGCGAATGRAAA